MNFEKINSNHKISIEASPNEADLAIVPINNMGSLGQLNEFVLSQYGYSVNDLPKKEQLQYGFGAIPDMKGKPILFVVTIDGGRKTVELLEENLYNTLIEFRGWIRNKKVWIPLMGTGEGGLSFEESYQVTARTINRFQNAYPTEVFVIISLYKTANNLYELLNANAESGEEHIKKFLNKLNCKFYLVGSMWGGEDQSDRFFKENIWEKGHDDESYAEIINEIKTGDILIIKSTFATSDRENYLRVKALGIVTHSSEDGGSVDVDWKIKGLKVDIAGLGFYRTTISKADLDDITHIFSFINQTLWEKLLSPNSISSSASKIAGLLSDTEKGVDYLDITKDVTAFARVIASRNFAPPLAVALFGKWGSGKSFFMRKLKEQIADFSARNTPNIYCEGIVQIQFNAWSYMDANLWASFVSKIFEGLNEYITENSKSEKAKDEIKRELSTTLNITKEELSILTDKSALIQEQIAALKIKRSNLQKDVDLKIQELKNQTIWKAIKKVDSEFKAKEKINEAFQSNDTFKQTEKELTKIIPEKYLDNPEEAYRQITSKYTFLKQFFRRDKIIINIIWLIVILGIIITIPPLLKLISAKIIETNFFIPQAILSLFATIGLAWRRAEMTYKKLQPIIASFWKIKEDYELEKKEAIAKFEQEDKALKQEIESGNEELKVLSEQIKNAEYIRSNLEFKINNALATEALYSFIDKRSKSDDYQKHLGIISIIRRDFETLNGLFTDHHQEIVKAEKAEAFRKNFSKPLQRIVLYIDDLDRCPEEIVVQVLEAVNLLMAFPLFIVVVGVDPRWVKNALLKKHTLHFAGLINGSENVKNGMDLIEPSDYLEKIFQIPFHLKDATAENVEQMIKQLAGSKPAIIPEQLKTVEDNIATTPLFEYKEDKLPNEEKPIDINNTLSITDELNIEVIETVELLELSDQEIKLMQDMGKIIGSNPRSVKRFVNIYKIIKAHQDYTLGVTSPIEDLLAVLFLLSLSVGRFKKLLPSFEDYILDERNMYKPITLYLQPNHKIGNLENLKHQLHVILSNQNSYYIIQQTMSDVIKKHNAFIKRFTFQSI